MLLSRPRDKIATEEHAIAGDGATSIRIPDPTASEKAMRVEVVEGLK